MIDQIYDLIARWELRASQRLTEFKREDSIAGREYLRTAGTIYFNCAAELKSALAASQNPHLIIDGAKATKLKLLREKELIDQELKKLEAV